MRACVCVVCVCVCVYIYSLFVLPLSQGVVCASPSSVSAVCVCLNAPICVCPNSYYSFTLICLRIGALIHYVSSYTLYMCPHPAIYVSSSGYIFSTYAVYMCPNTAARMLTCADVC